MRIIGRLLALAAFATGGLVAINHIQIARIALDDPDYWDGGRGPESLMLTLGVFGGGALIMGLVALPAFLGVFLGGRGRRSAFWFLLLPAIIGLLVAGAATAAWVALQPEGVKLLPFVVAPLAVPPLLALLAGLLIRTGVGRREPAAPAVAS